VVDGLVDPGLLDRGQSRASFSARSSAAASAAARAVLDVRAGMPVTEVAARYGVSRQSVHARVRRYEQGGLGALADRSRRPESCPDQVSADVEAAVCEMRREHPKWGPLRLAHELGKAGVVLAPSRMSVYRVLVRHGLIEPEPRKRPKDSYLRWERDEPMALWQLDIVGGVFLADGTEAKVVTGVDDHSRYCVIASVVARATGRAVCLAFAAALRAYGVPGEVLTDNGKQFTDRFGKGGEVLFDRICRDNGIVHRLTQPRSPTTTGKIERFHGSLRRELLGDAVPFADLAAAQAAVDAWVLQYNTARPHQAIGMAVPADRSAPPARRLSRSCCRCGCPPSWLWPRSRRPVTMAGFDREKLAVYVWRSVRAGGDTKTKKSRRTLEVPDEVARALRQHHKKQAAKRLRAGETWQDLDLVFCTRNGKPLAAGNVRRAFRSITEAAGIGKDWTPRELRHTFVSMMSDNDVPIEKIADLVGHRTTIVTQTVYRHQLRPVIDTGATAMNAILNRQGQTQPK
jgi:transposase InsO family protein